MSSDWLSLFVHQGKEFIDSVSPRKSNDGDEILAAESAPQNSASVMASSVESDNETSLVIKEANVATGKLVENGIEVSSERTTSNSKESLDSAEKYIYETQLEQLQEQLVDLMIQNQEMG